MYVLDCIQIFTHSDVQIISHFFTHLDIILGLFSSIYIYLIILYNQLYFILTVLFINKLLIYFIIYIFHEPKINTFTRIIPLLCFNK